MKSKRKLRKTEIQRELKKSKWNQVDSTNQRRNQSGIQKSSNKLKTKNKNLGSLVEKMSQVLR
jgi:hypothetical protein